MKLRDYQQEACDRVWFAVRRGLHPIVNLPTGSGKSLVIAELIRKAVCEFKGRVVVTAHRKELLHQQREHFYCLCPDIPSGIYSAGLKQRDLEYPVVFAGIQSIFAKAEQLGKRQLCLVDECHLIDPQSCDTMYGQFLAGLKEQNDPLYVAGLSATPYRLGQGCLTDGSIFDIITYSAPLAKLIEQGYLCSLVTQLAESEVSMEGVDIRRGEYVSQQAEDRFIGGDNVSRAVRELFQKTADRHSVLVFSSGVVHAERIESELQALTSEADVRVILGETDSLDRAAAIDKFRRGELKYLINCQVLTTGFDAPNIDTIAALFATASPGLWAQICGRGLRTHESKTDCLILDYGGNMERHGPLDSESYGKFSKRKSSNNGDTEAVWKYCEKCGQANHPRTMFCIECQHPFEFKHDAETDEDGDILSKAKWLTVNKIWYALHVKKGTQSRTMRVDYQCDSGGLAGTRVSEWVCIEHNGFAHDKACIWWQVRSVAEIPSSIEDAMYLAECGALREPTRIKARRDGKYWRIEEVEFESERPRQWQEKVSVFVDDDDIPF